MTVTTKVESVVSESLKDEINSITTTDKTTEYQPQAWTREGSVD